MVVEMAVVKVGRVATAVVKVGRVATALAAAVAGYGIYCSNTTRRIATSNRNSLEGWSTDERVGDAVVNAGLP